MNLVEACLFMNVELLRWLLVVLIAASLPCNSFVAMTVVGRVPGGCEHREAVKYYFMSMRALSIAEHFAQASHFSISKLSINFVWF